MFKKPLHAAIATSLLLCLCLIGCSSIKTEGSFAVQNNSSSIPTGTSSSSASTNANSSSGPEASDTLTDIQKTLAATAQSFLGKKILQVGDKTFPYDCTGLILAIYYAAGIDLLSYFNRYTGNGVARLYALNADFDLLNTNTIPQTGELIFWDNTYDRNGDAKWNDEFTHVGFVLSSDETGNIQYIHLNYRKGIVIEYMNLKELDVYTNASGKIINSPMRMKSHRYINPNAWLASHLFRAFGSTYRLQRG